MPPKTRSSQRIEKWPKFIILTVCFTIFFSDFSEHVFKFVRFSAVYDGTADLAEGETAESRFIQIQAAYELLSDVEERRKYDNENRQNPMKVLLSRWFKWR